MTLVQQNLVSDSALGLARVGPAVSHEALRQLLERDGAVIVENVLEPSALRRLKDELNPWFQDALSGEGAFFGRSTRRFSGLFAKSACVADLAANATVLEAIEAILKGPPEHPSCDAIELNLTQAIAIEPGETPQFLHRDEDLWPFPNTFEIMANAMWMIDDFTIENGATRLIPGSHRWPRDREPVPGEALSATAPAGSVVLWLGGVLHGGGANASQDTRRGLVISYRLGWLASAEKLLLSTPLEIARKLPERVQRLLGYQVHRPNLGWIEGQDPLKWLKGEIGPLAHTADNLTASHEALLMAVQEHPENFLGYLS
jgi:ectoine hydroxylase-related dioxygenase (phytanoyl-CoA dioxygenase family)